MRHASYGTYYYLNLRISKNTMWKLPNVDLFGLKRIENSLTLAMNAQLEANKLLVQSINENEKRANELEARIEGLETGAQDHYAKATERMAIAREAKVERAQTRTEMIGAVSLLSKVPEETIKEALGRFNISDGMLAAGYKLISEHPEKIEEIKKKLGIGGENGGSGSPSTFMYG